MRQLIKFCLVGATSTIIDVCVLGGLLSVFKGLPWWIAKSISFIFGVTNGFIWNRRWTFRDQVHGAARQQYIKFVFTNVVGFFLNLMITKGFLIFFTGQFSHNHNPDVRTVQIASLCAVPIVVIWNFSAARLLTFRAPKASASAPAVSTPPVGNP
jgi:putative flippase GtrA